MDIKQFEKVEIYLQKKWIPLFIENFSKDSFILFPTPRGKGKEEFDKLIKEMLIEFNKQVSIKRIEMHKDCDKKRIMSINN